MTQQRLENVEKVTELISSGKPLLIAGDEGLLKSLPEGNWIAGTIPYFMAEEGGQSTRDKLFVTELPEYIEGFEIRSYDETTIKNVYLEAPDSGFSLIIIPASSPIHLSFALNAPDYENFGYVPLIGWISGVHLDDLSIKKPLVFNGKETTSYDNRAVVMHITLPKNKYPEIKILNIFKQGIGDTITFPEDGFHIKNAYINGDERNFAEYILENKLDIRLPLVANYNGAMINISFQAVNEENKTVDLYAPVFKGIEYRQADSIPDYVSTFTANMPKDDVDRIAFSCNCILNYLYSELEGKQTGGVVGPITFGEVAYQLLNQTLAYITITDV